MAGNITMDWIRGMHQTRSLIPTRTVGIQQEEFAPDNSIATSMWGEALSNYEEFKISQDDGYSVRPGLYLSSIDRPLDVDFLTETSQPRIADSAIVGTHVSENQGIVVIASKNGVTILDPLSYTPKSSTNLCRNNIRLIASISGGQLCRSRSHIQSVSGHFNSLKRLNLDSSFFYNQTQYCP